jgi:tetratricopeptide (TPR) repeat protein
MAAPPEPEAAPKEGGDGEGAPQPEPEPEPEPELDGAAPAAADASGASVATDGTDEGGTNTSATGSDATSSEAPADGKKPAKSSKKSAKPKEAETPPDLLKRTEAYLGGCEAVSKELAALVTKFGRCVGMTVGSRALLGENLVECVRGEEGGEDGGEMNSSVFECLNQFTMKLDGLTANARLHEEAIKKAGKLIAAVQKPAKTAKETAKEYSKAESALRKTLVARKEYKGKAWKEPRLWPPLKWQETRKACAQDPSKQGEAEKTLDAYGNRFWQSQPSTGKWSMKEREQGMKQFREQVDKMGLETSPQSPAYAKSKIYMGYVYENAGFFGDAAESFQDALDALDEQSENLQEDENAPWWKAQQEESDARFEAMDTLGGEQVRRLLAAGH